MKITLIEKWDDNDAMYAELKLGKYEACCVKKTASGTAYVLQCEDGNEVYSDIGGADFPLRMLTDTEKEEIMEFIRKEVWAPGMSEKEKANELAYALGLLKDPNVCEFEVHCAENADHISGMGVPVEKINETTWWVTPRSL